MGCSSSFVWTSLPSVSTMIATEYLHGISFMRGRVVASHDAEGKGVKEGLLTHPLLLFSCRIRSITPRCHSCVP